MHGEETFLQTPEFWVAVAFVIFCAVIVYTGAPKKVIEALDQRSKRIKSELDEARRLREEAAQLLAEYQRKQREAENEAAGIITSAKAEAQALADVRAAAADAAVTAAEKILSETVKGKVSDDLVAQGIADAAAKLKVN